MQTLLDMRSIRKTFPGVVALNEVNLRVRAGEIHALVGENGAGKSTLMKVLSGVYPAGSYTGQILFDGQERHFSGIHDSERLGIIIIHQELALVPLLSITENYPDLKSNQNFLALQSQLEGTENRIAISRRDYNEAARVYNTTLRTFPSVIWAKTLYSGQKPALPFTAAVEAQTAPTVSFDAPAAPAAPAAPTPK